MPSCMLTMVDVSLGSLQWYVSPLTLHDIETAPVFHHLFSVHQDFPHPFLSTLSTGPPPPPPLPPPPDLLEVPPTPVLADEEEEEEMLLRETCLMSMVNKRVAVTEVCWMSCKTSACTVSNRSKSLILHVCICVQETSCSAPGSPNSQPPTASQPPARGNLSTVSLNTVSHSRINKFGGHQRAPLVVRKWLAFKLCGVSDGWKWL